MTADDLNALDATAAAVAELEWEPPATGEGRRTTIRELVTGSSFDLRLAGEGRKMAWKTAGG